MKTPYKHILRDIVILSFLFSIAVCGIFYFSSLSHALIVLIASALIFSLPVIVAVFMVFLRRNDNDLNDSENLFRSALENTSVGMALVSTDGHWFLVNAALCKMLEYSKEELEKRTVQDITYPEDLPNTNNILKQLNSGEKKYYDTEKRYISKTGKIVWVHVSAATILNKEQRPQYFVVHIENISLRKTFELANINLANNLYDEKEHLRILLSSIVDAVIATDEHGLINFMNVEAEKLTGWVYSDVKGMPNEHVFSIVDQNNTVLKSPIAHCMNTRIATLPLQYAVLIDKNKKKYDIQYSVSLLQNRKDQLIGAEVVFQNITKEKTLQEELHYNATHDALTGLLNRKEFEKAINKAVEDLKSKGMQYILCYLDLDFFKIINDAAGHMAGDALLREVASLLHRRLRKVDILARLGGDEFGILLLNSSLSTGKEICQQLIELVNTIRFVWNKKTYHVDMSIGMVMMADSSRLPSQLLSDADVACYAAKSEGRNRVFIYQSDQAESMEYSHRIVLANTIQEALEQNRLLIYAQKIISTHPAHSAGTSYELLLRLLDDNQNIISASAFVVTAERFNLMAQIDRWCLTQVLTQLDKELSALDVTYFSINLSANSLNDPRFLPFVLKLIKQSTLKPERLCFEITETAAMSHISETIQLMEELQYLGCKIALDDFGAGLSSFSYVKNFLVDIIKIDGFFIKNVVSSTVDRTIVQTINDMAHHLNMTTIAEYVENQDILSVITEIGVDYAQGYGIGEPEPLSGIFDKKSK